MHVRRVQQLALLLLAAAALLAPAPAAAQSSYCRSLKHKRFIRVSSDRQLRAAVDSASAGDLIELQDGRYSPLKIKGKYGSGPKQEQSITLCGSRKAIVSGSPALTDYLVYVQKCAYIRLVGFTAMTGFKGVSFDGVVSSLIAGMVITHVATCGVHLKLGSSGNIVYYNWVSDTGHLMVNGARFGGTGEGVYIGLPVVSGVIDHSDYNRIVSNIIGPGVTAEMVDIKEFTSRGQILGNVFDASGLLGQHYAVSCINAKGNSYLIQGNKCSRPLAEGYATHTLAPGWGAYNLFRGNKCSGLRSGNNCVIFASGPYPGARKADMGNVWQN